MRFAMRRLIQKANEKSRLIVEYVLIGTIVALCCSSYKLFQDKVVIEKELAIAKIRVASVEQENEQQTFKIIQLESELEPK